jgi:hypothetical protein
LFLGGVEIAPKVQQSKIQFVSFPGLSIPIPEKETSPQIFNRGMEIAYDEIHEN